MRSFWAGLWPLLSDRARRKVVGFLAGAVGLALVESLALLCLTPLLRLLTAPTTTGAVPRLLRPFVGGGSGAVAPLATLVVLAFLGKGVLTLWQQRRVAEMSVLEEAALTERLMTVYLRAPLVEHRLRNSAQFQRTVNTSLRDVFGNALPNVIGTAGDLVSLVAVGIVLVVSDVLVSAAMAAYFVTVVCGYLLFSSPRLRRDARTIHDEMPQMHREVHEAITGVRDIVLAGGVTVVARQVRARRLRLLEPLKTVALMSLQPRVVLETAMVGAALLVCVVAYGSRPAGTATALVGLFLAGGFRMLAPLNKILSTLAMTKRAAPALVQVLSDLRQLQAPEQDWLPEPDVVAAMRADATVRFEGVTYVHAGRADEDPTAAGAGVHDLTFTIERGECAALVGPSGSGKSTVVDLLLAMLEPDDGAVTVGGCPVESHRPSWWSVVALVPQEVVLRDASVRENVALGVELARIHDADVWAALAEAQVDDVVRRLPSGLDTVVGERGARLSGGQRQRLGIARALFQRPAVLVLDEATSSLDGETERRVLDVVHGLRGRVTVLAVAHRGAALALADRVLTLEDGRLVPDASVALTRR